MRHMVTLRDTVGKYKTQRCYVGNGRSSPTTRNGLPWSSSRHGKPAGLLVGFRSEDDWFDSRLEHDPRFLARIERARSSLRAGRGVRLEDVEE
jgi:hypothetical protein